MNKLRKDAIDLTGKVFGKLTAKYSSNKEGRRGRFWTCDCSCGKEAVAQSSHLIAGVRVSCGCLGSSRIYETGVNRLLSLYKRKSLLKKRDFLLTREEFKLLIESVCFYCGKEPQQNLKRSKSTQTQILYNGIDRKDSSVGYTMENCVSACRLCNQAKSILSIEDFKSHIKRICKWLSIDLA